MTPSPFATRNPRFRVGDFVTVGNRPAVVTGLNRGPHDVQVAGWDFELDRPWCCDFASWQITHDIHAQRGTR